MDEFSFSVVATLISLQASEVKHQGKKCSETNFCSWSCWPQLVIRGNADFNQLGSVHLLYAVYGLMSLCVQFFPLPLTSSSETLQIKIWTLRCLTVLIWLTASHLYYAGKNMTKCEMESSTLAEFTLFQRSEVDLSLLFLRGVRV